MTPDEGAGIVDDAVYTNAAAARTLQFASLAARKLNMTANPLWAVQSARPYLPLVANLSGDGAVHPEFRGYNGAPIAQSCVALMQYPLRWPMPADVARRDLAFYQVRSSGPTTAGFFTGDSSYSIAWLGMGNKSQADAQFAQAFSHLDLVGFSVWMEKFYAQAQGGALNEISSGGAFLQNILYGYAGVSLEEEGVAIRPTLPALGVTALTLRGVAFAGSRVRYAFNASHLRLELSKAGESALEVMDAAGGRHALPVALPLQPVLLRQRVADSIQ
eukprot:COSAG04_NODE_437_length_14435_cov_4.075126_11_plen_274_part_00